MRRRAVVVRPATSPHFSPALTMEAVDPSFLRVPQRSLRLCVVYFLGTHSLSAGENTDNAETRSTLRYAEKSSLIQIRLPILMRNPGQQGWMLQIML